MTTVKDVLGKKGGSVYFISPDASVFDALQIMADKDIDSLIVLDA